MKKDWQEALISVLIAELIGLLSSGIAGNVRMEYLQYAKPPLSPPGWVFGVAWTILYALMGLAAYLVYISDNNEKFREQGLILYAIQLFFNFIWSIVFFRFNLLWGSVVIIIVLAILVIAAINVFYKINKTAAYLMIPYLLWILFATYLNIGIAILN